MQPAGERDITQAAPAHGAHAAGEPDAAPSISVEGVIWVVLVLAAGLLRLADLDRLPFSVDEAARSLDALRVADGDVPETWRGDLGATATSHAFRIFGETELVARLIPALAGLSLIAALWWMRPYIGRTGALVAAILVAFSPLFVFHSRMTTEYGIGPLISVIIVVSLFSYLRNPRIAAAFPLIVALALALLADAPAVLAVLAVLVFVLLETMVFRNRDLAVAGRAFRSSPLQWVSALLVVAACVQLGVTRFGTSLDAGLPGLELLGDMFDSPRESQAAEFHLALLLGYDWPLFLAGAAGFAVLAIRFVRRRSLTAFERFLLLWALTGAFALALGTPGEAGQLLVLLLPLAVLAGRAAQEVTGVLDWDVARRWWPAAAGLAAVVAIAALLMTEWSSGNASTGERAILAATPLTCPVLLAVATIRSRAATAMVLPAGIIVAAAFLAHSSLAVAFGDGTEFAVDARLTPRAVELRRTLDRLSAERNTEVVLDADLIDELGWTLRNSRAVFSGDAATASILVSRPNAAPAGFAGLQDVWRVTEGWYPDDVLAPRRMWRWLLYREPFGPIDFVDVRIYVRTI